MKNDLATELHSAGRAHGAASCLLYRASMEQAGDEKVDDPEAYAFNGPYSLSVHYLLGLGLELMLKSAIVSWSAKADPKYLQYKIGHDLVAALDEAEHEGFKSQAPHLRDLVKLLREPYKRHWFRYERPDQIALPGDFDQVVNTLTILDSEVAAKLQPTDLAKA